MERLASSPPHARTPVTVVPESRFMQNYRVASAVHGGSSASAIVNGRGDVELFTSGSNTEVWNIYPDPQSTTANSATATGLTGEVIATGLTPSGDIVLFAAQGTNLLYCVEQPTSASRWSAVKMIDVPLPSNAIRMFIAAFNRCGTVPFDISPAGAVGTAGSVDAPTALELEERDHGR